MTTETTEGTQEIADRAEAAVEKYKQHAEELKEEVGNARAATKVQIKAMIQRLENQYEEAKERLSELKGGDTDELHRFHQEIVGKLADMKKTIKRRIR